MADIPSPVVWRIYLKTSDFLEATIDTRFLIPSWWVRAYEEALQLSDQPFGFNDTHVRGIGPFFGCSDLYFCPLIISHLQRQFLRPSENSQISLGFGEIEKDAGVRTLKDACHLRRLLSEFSSTKIFVEKSDRVVVEPLFVGESWIPAERNTQLCLELSQPAHEVFTGYIDGYSDLLRVKKGHGSLRQVLGNDPPLLLSRSLWHETRGIELGVLLRVQKAMQWQTTCINLEGVFGLSLASMFAGNVARNSRGKIHTLKRKLSLLANVFKKLTEHGCLTTLGSEEFFAFESNDLSVDLLWKESNNNAGGQEHEVFLDSVFRKFSQRKDFLQNLIENLKSADESDLCRNSGEDYQKVLQMKQLESISYASSGKGYIVVEGNIVLPFIGLYWEWVFRKDSNHPMALPNVLVHTELFKLLPSVKEEFEIHLKAFHRFCKIFSESKGCHDLFREEPRLSIVRIKPQMSVLNSSNLQKLSLKDKIENSRSLGLNLRGIENSSFDSKTSLKLRANKNDLLCESGRKIGTKNSSAQFTVRQGVKSDKEVISSEIDRLRADSRASYSDLVKMYLESLDISAQHVIIEIKNRMQPRVFEQHLQPRLVQFAIDHHEKWKKIRNL